MERRHSLYLSGILTAVAAAAVVVLLLLLVVVVVVVVVVFFICLLFSAFGTSLYTFGICTVTL